MSEIREAREWKRRWESLVEETDTCQAALVASVEREGRLRDLLERASGLILCDRHIERAATSCAECQVEEDVRQFLAVPTPARSGTESGAQNVPALARGVDSGGAGGAA